MYEQVFFSQTQNHPDGGIDYVSLLDVINGQGGPTKAIRILQDWHHPGEHRTYDVKPWGANDQTHKIGPYVLNWNESLGYVGLCYEVE
jgi:V8-like Glu-specific endopeptidase